VNNLSAVIWLALTVAFVVMEATTVQLICIWFAAGSLAAMVVGLLGGALWLQILVFFAVSILLLILLWPLAKKHFKPLKGAAVQRTIEGTGATPASGFLLSGYTLALLASNKTGFYGLPILKAPRRDQRNGCGAAADRWTICKAR